ncbi:hypothetical protein CARUB_v10014615mg [Capsella rubella]|uniref:Serine aminopeptidase S33 domain-containing protein n=2 Tax=Capsella rubella TaxID=81985 RepID=R0I0Q1_9BRAS|nr:hypothetical protein CARUB_v10014615mg [Capsella rubella]
MEYVRAQTKPKDGKLLAGCHSMGGILLYAMLSRCEPSEAINLPIMPIDTMLAMAHPLMFRPPYALSWLTANISAPQMMDPEVIEKLVLNSLSTVPVKLLLQLTTVVNQGGLCDRTGTFYYKDHISKTNVPILALAGDWDIICPPDAVYGS